MLLLAFFQKRRIIAGEKPDRFLVFVIAQPVRFCSLGNIDFEIMEHDLRERVIEGLNTDPDDALREV